MDHLMLFLKGLAMGAANVIPGVSGGTVAFITGIYERLIHALKSLDLTALRLLLSGRFREFARRTDLYFLTVLFLGVFLSIVSLAKVLELAFLHYEIYTLAFFFGLILASVIAVARQVEKINTGTVTSFLLGTAIAIIIAFLPPVQSNTTLLYLILCGVVAVCSMILPGLSGSYVLLLMGNYWVILGAISRFDLSILLPVLLGCAAGLILLSRLLSWLFRHFKDITISLLAGFVAGSLLIIWPWKTTLYETLGEKEKAAGYIWQLPQIDLPFFIALLLILIGFLLIWKLEKHAPSHDTT